VDRKKKVMKIVTDKLGAIESTSQSMIDVLTYINSQTVDDQKIRIALTNDTLVYTMTISAPPEVKEEEKKGSEKPEEEESEEEEPEGGKPEGGEPEEKKPEEKKPEEKKPETSKSSGLDIPSDTVTREKVWNSINKGNILISNIYKPPDDFFVAIKKIFMDLTITTLENMNNAINASSYDSNVYLAKDAKSTKTIPGDKKKATVNAWKSTIISKINITLKKYKDQGKF
jgi:hypothetical protein